MLDLLLRVFICSSFLAFISAWKDFLKEPTNESGNLTIDLEKLICPHGRFMYSSNFSILQDTSDYRLIDQSEWDVLKSA